MEDTIGENPNRIPRGTLWLYSFLFAAAMMLVIFDIYTHRINQLVLSVPIAAMLLGAIMSDREVSHIPPVLIIAMVITLMFAVVSDFIDFHEFFSILSSVFTGVCLMMLGLVFVYTLVRSTPQQYRKDRIFLYMGAFCVAMTILLIMFITQIAYYHFVSYLGFDVWVATQYVFYAMIGAFVTTILSEMGLDRILIDSRVNRRMEYAESDYSNEYARDEALRIIASGESEKLEFKSTITTNITTGENDKRMEKAILKTIVAFLNTSGGILMIGVSDDGSIYGVDEDEFPSRDKMNLHLTNMISSKIGDEFFPYISFRLIDMDDGKAIIRVDCARCKKPVFLKEGKEEEFYVRSGPSSVVLKGSNLINYVNNKSEKNKQDILLGMMRDNDD